MDDMKDKKEVLTHLTEHITYPASKEDIMKACEDMSDVPEKDKEWLKSALANKVYQDAEEVQEALKMM